MARSALKAPASGDASASVPPEELFTVDEIATLAKVSPKTVRRWLERGILSSIRVRRLVRISASQYNQMIERGSIK